LILKLKKIIITSAIFLLCSCSNQEKETTDNNKMNTKQAASQDVKPTSAPVTQKVNLSKEDLKKYKPNELGLVMVLEYHLSGKKEERWTRTPDNFRKDLNKLYKEGYYLTPLRDFVNNTMNVPLGKTPVILTFDDSSASQFRYLKKGSEKIIDPDCPVGIIEDFCKKHPDFGKAATFYVLPRLAFGQTPEDATAKLKFLSENGYEIGNHTLDHTNLTTVNDQKVQEAIAENIITLHKFLPDYEVNTLAYPYGGVPKNLKLAESGEYKGTKYHNIAALLVGAEPSLSPNSKKFKPLLIPRIQAIQTELDRHFKLFKDSPEYRYISDGNPETITVPSKLPKYLEKTLKESDKVVRY
jgi:peptidoglycan/xylan/chitin deacetylase (PgdA/CDA1 family)